MVEEDNGTSAGCKDHAVLVDALPARVHSRRSDNLEKAPLLGFYVPASGNLKRSYIFDRMNLQLHYLVTLTLFNARARVLSESRGLHHSKP